MATGYKNTKYEKDRYDAVVEQYGKEWADSYFDVEGGSSFWALYETGQWGNFSTILYLVLCMA